MSRAWAGGSNTAWRKTRALVIIRDNGRCQIRTPGICLIYADQVHHKLGKSISERLEDLEAACGPCNRRVGDPSTRDPTPQPRQQW
jgi:5-methylcytosine-specific restriction endonuclease McrA